MRFLKDGPDIPDKLLTARDEGRVVFFCGAGVSRARAGLADFFGLADDVLSKLGVADEHPAYKIILEAKEIESRTGVSGLISADRIFGLLERDFLSRDIEASVASSLSSHDNVDLSAHKIMLNLATTPEGKIRIVTTNFDRLFECCSEKLTIWEPPRLPDPFRQSDMDGIVHLHGCVNSDYTGSNGDGFVLSSSEFGRAYLSDGWATQFVRDILSLYVVVFVGYTADDPPVQYLLEALNKKTDKIRNVYAFQSGVADEAFAKWQHKGVEAIPYGDNDSHRMLWDSLDAWAVRAKSPENWMNSVINMAKKGPETLEPHERGQVAHVISTTKGAEKFAEKDNPPPAAWLYVFDPNFRYSKPIDFYNWDDIRDKIDPFNLYGLDKDEIPKPIDPENYFAKRDVPSNAWDGFAANELDLKNLKRDRYSEIRGGWSTNVPRLSSRLSLIGSWISNVSTQPTTVSWASIQKGIHPDIQRIIQWSLEKAEKEVSHAVIAAWNYLFDFWEDDIGDYYRNLYKLKGVIKKVGWNSSVRRKYAKITKPYIIVKGSSWKNSKNKPKSLEVKDIINIDVKYPKLKEKLKVPKDWISSVVKDFRKNLEIAVQLESEIGSYGLMNICSIEPEDDGEIGGFERDHALSGLLIAFTEYFDQLVKDDLSLARQEYDTWKTFNNHIFIRLKIWSSGKKELVTPEKFGELILSLSDDDFWDSEHNRDLLIVLGRRWNELPIDISKSIEKRILKGRSIWENEEEEEYLKRKAFESVNRLHWLSNQGIKFSFDLDIETKKLEKEAPHWEKRYAEKAAQSMGSMSGWVTTATDYSELLHLPIAKVLEISEKLSGKTENFLTEKDPFAGLSAERPNIAFEALIDASTKGSFPVWAWRTFLNSEERKNDKPEFIIKVGNFLRNIPDSQLNNLSDFMSNWLFATSEKISLNDESLFDDLFCKILHSIMEKTEDSTSDRLDKNTDPDWAIDALNSPVGKISQALFYDSRVKELQSNSGFPDKWIKNIEKMLVLKGDYKRHALVFLGHRLNWFYARDYKWTEVNLLSILNRSDDLDCMALWSGFFWSAKFPFQSLYIKLKPYFIDLAKRKSLKRSGYNRILASMILIGWGSIKPEDGKRYVTNSELRDVLLSSGESFRLNLLSNLRQRSKNNKPESKPNWSDLSKELLRDVWPRQISVKTSNISASLFEIAFEANEKMSELTDIVLPLLTKISHGKSISLSLYDSERTIAQYPKQTLALLHAILPEDVSTWPYETEKALENIENADSKLRYDERLIELKRKWNSR